MKNHESLFDRHSGDWGLESVCYAEPQTSSTKSDAAQLAGETDSAGALLDPEHLCTKYWRQMYEFVRQRGSDSNDAKDLTQAFFTHLIEKEAFKKIDLAKGKVSSFLMAALTNFLYNEWDKRQSLKRGGQRQIVSLEETGSDHIYACEPLGSELERPWASNLTEKVMTQLKREYAAIGRTELFETLEPGIMGETGPGAHARWAAILRVNEGSVRVALHRLRRRFGELLRREIALTVAGPTEVADEIRNFFAALSA